MPPPLAERAVIAPHGSCPRPVALLCLHVTQSAAWGRTSGRVILSVQAPAVPARGQGMERRAGAPGARLPLALRPPVPAGPAPPVTRPTSARAGVPAAPFSACPSAAAAVSPLSSKKPLLRPPILSPRQPPLSQVCRCHLVTCPSLQGGFGRWEWEVSPAPS